MKDIIIIVARGKDGAIGKNGNLLWNLPGDLKRFKELTLGHPVVMGRKTWDSLPKKPLPGRRNIVITRNQAWHEEGAQKVSSIDEAMEKIGNEDAFIIGGAEIYKAFLPLASRLLLTEVDDAVSDADAFLPFDPTEWIETQRSEDFTTPNGIKFRYIDFKRK